MIMVDLLVPTSPLRTLQGLLSIFETTLQYLGRMNSNERASPSNTMSPTCFSPTIPQAYAQVALLPFRSTSDTTHHTVTDGEQDTTSISGFHNTPGSKFTDTYTTSAEVLADEG